MDSRKCSPLHWFQPYEFTPIFRHVIVLTQKPTSLLFPATVNQGDTVFAMLFRYIGHGLVDIVSLIVYTQYKTADHDSGLETGTTNTVYVFSSFFLLFSLHRRGVNTSYFCRCCRPHISTTVTQFGYSSAARDWGFKMCYLHYAEVALRSRTSCRKKAYIDRYLSTDILNSYD